MTRILWVEDDENQRTLYREEFEADGYQVATAPDGRSGLRALEGSRPDLVILDIAMPQMDGIEFLQRAAERAPGVPLVIFSSYSSYKDNFLTWIADAYVVKTANLDGLKTIVRGLLKRPEAAAN